MTFLTTIAAIWLFTSIFFMLYSIGRDVCQFVKKRNKRKDLHYLRHCSKPQDGPKAIIGGEAPLFPVFKIPPPTLIKCKYAPVEDHKRNMDGKVILSWGDAEFYLSEYIRRKDASASMDDIAAAMDVTHKKVMADGSAFLKVNGRLIHVFNRGLVNTEHGGGTMGFHIRKVGKSRGAE